MYRIKLCHIEKKYLFEELIKIFLSPAQYTIIEEDDEEPDCIVINEANAADKNQIKREIYDKLSMLTGARPEWGILTGIRPVKLCGEFYEQMQDEQAVLDILIDQYYLHEKKAKQILAMYLHQKSEIGFAPANSVGVYIGIPFCPTRCVYCSFASNQVPDTEIQRYLPALYKEIEYTAARMKATGMLAESIYIGGGTPTTLTAKQLSALIGKIKESFDLSGLKEFTIEAGRPDTITREKLAVMQDAGIDRISINPQTMKAETLALIGRNHSPEDIRRTFAQAKEMNFAAINCDVIAGLPQETEEDFAATLKELIAMEPENITVHCLAVKRASKLIGLDPDFHYKQANRAEQMLNISRRLLAEAGYAPYYLYRQKHMAGAFENTGYSKPGKECVYNIRIMDEHQTIMALGAGGITKVYFPSENRLERVPNVSNYQEYISRIDEMLERKEKNVFKEVKTWQS